MNRRAFLGTLAATGGVFVPTFGRWFRPPAPSGYTDTAGGLYILTDAEVNELWQKVQRKLATGFQMQRPSWLPSDFVAVVPSQPTERQAMSLMERGRLGVHADDYLVHADRVGRPTLLLETTALP